MLAARFEEYFPVLDSDFFQRFETVGGKPGHST